MKTTKTISVMLCAALLAAPMTASAQFGGLGRKLLGGGGSTSGVSSADASAFLGNALLSTKNVMISAALLSQALSDRTQLASQKARIDAITTAQDFKELDSHKAELESDLQQLSQRKDLAADLTATYRAGNADQKRLIGIALINLGIGVYRNVGLVGQAPGMVEGVGGNPQLLRRVGEFRMAASLLALQGKSLVTIGTVLPKVMSSLKIQAPAASDTSETQHIVL